MSKRVVYLGIGLFLLPLLAAGAFILVVRAQAIFRYDPTYFTPAYQEEYPSPGTVAIAIEEALHRGDRPIFAELTGLRRKIEPPEPNPNARLMILLEISDRDYYQFLFFDVKNYHRMMFNVKEVNGRWVMAPQDAFYYLDSGEWLLFFTPALVLYWSLLGVVLLGVAVFTLAAKFRKEIYEPQGEHQGEPRRDGGKHDRIDG